MSGLSAWLTAARVHTLPAAVVPVLVGSALAAGDGVFRWDAFLWALSGALAIQVAANFANDASDARRGADTPDRLGPPRMVSLGVIDARSMWAGTWIAVGVAAIAALALTAIAGPLVLVIGVAAVAAMLGYVGGPLPYGYRALGEVFVFVFFGLVATVGSRFVHDGTAPLAAWLLAVPIGFLVTAILVANNYRDRRSDGAVAKKTLAVVLGERRTRVLFAALVYGAFLLIAVFAAVGVTPRWTALALLAVLTVPLPVRLMRPDSTGPEMIRALKATAATHLFAGTLLAIGSII
jgi:1,4-dihydroxy-2-naphthoate polyprenyltransferase